MFDLWDFIMDYIMPIIITIFFILMIIGLAVFTYIGIQNISKTDYIQNLEEKLNIYERSYEEFCLEDSIRQGNIYE